DRRAREMPNEAVPGSAAADDLVGHRGIGIEDGIELRRRGMAPGLAEHRHAALHAAEHEARLLAQALGAGVAEADGALAVAGTPLLDLGAAGDDEVAARAGRLPRIGEGVEARLGRVALLRADIAARHRVGVALHHAPALERADIVPVEGDEARLAEGRGRAQLAGAEGEERHAFAAEMALDPGEALRQRNRVLEFDALDAEACERGHAARVLEDAGDVAESAGGNIDRGLGHCCLSRRLAHGRRLAALCQRLAALLSLAQAAPPSLTLALKGEGIALIPLPLRGREGWGWRSEATQEDAHGIAGHGRAGHRRQWRVGAAHLPRAGARRRRDRRGLRAKP